VKKIIHFLVFCLVATCNAELRTWTAVNGKKVDAEFVSNEKGIVKLKLKSGKSFEVPANKLSKKDNEFISSLAKPEGVNLKELDLREGIIYLKGSDTPYAGKVSALYENGQMKAEVNYKDGKREGLTIGWYKNGQKKSEENYKGGKPDGLVFGWYENGQKKSEENYKGGKPDGLVFGWYENGKKKVEGNFKKGKQYGLHVMWYENEQKEFEANFKDGKCEGLVEEWHENGQKKWEANCKEGKPVKGSEKFWNSKGVSVDTIEEAEAE
jgi:antitoxin component YwqK of YwqJK toxin-antitoxin module